MKVLKTIAITGATGQQGGAVAHALLNSGFKIRALTRNTNSAPAEALRNKGAEIVRTNFDDPASLESAFSGSDSAFIMSTLFEKGTETETDRIH